MERTYYTNITCLVPCNITEYKLEYLERSYDPDDPTRMRAGPEDKFLDITFRNFAFTYSEEHLACDTTCVHGELGENLGFLSWWFYSWPI